MLNGTILVNAFERYDGGLASIESHAVYRINAYLLL